MSGQPEQTDASWAEGPGRLYATVGNSHSGKSTYCKRWVLARRETERPRAIVSGDAFRIGVTGEEYNAIAEGCVFSAMDVAIRGLLHTGFDVIIDETCTTEATIQRYLQIDRDVVFISMPGDADVCCARAIACGKARMVPVIRKFAEQLKNIRRGFQERVDRIREDLDRRERIYLEWKNAKKFMGYKNSGRDDCPV